MINYEAIASDSKSIEDSLNRALAELYLLEIFSMNDCYIGELNLILRKRSRNMLYLVSPYKVFYRLAEAGYLIEKNKRIAPDGRLRLYYSITEAGHAYHLSLLETYQRFSSGVKVFVRERGNLNE